jgi:hypothetical protein
MRHCWTCGVSAAGLTKHSLRLQLLNQASNVVSVAGRLGVRASTRASPFVAGQGVANPPVASVFCILVCLLLRVIVVLIFIARRKVDAYIDKYGYIGRLLPPFGYG